MYLGFLEGSVATIYRGRSKSGVIAKSTSVYSITPFTAVLAFDIEMAPNPSGLCLLGLPYVLTAIDARISLAQLRTSSSS